MFLHKEEDIKLLNDILDTYPNLHNYFVELFLYFYLYKKELLNDILQKYEDEPEFIDFDKLSHMIEKAKQNIIIYENKEIEI